MEHFVIIVNGWKRFVIIVNGWKPLTIITKDSILDSIMDTKDSIFIIMPNIIKLILISEILKITFLKCYSFPGFFSLNWFRKFFFCASWKYTSKLAYNIKLAFVTKLHRNHGWNFWIFLLKKRAVHISFLSRFSFTNIFKIPMTAGEGESYLF